MARKLKLDMTDVESFVKCAEGEHIARLSAIEEKAASTGVDMLAATFEVIKGSSTGAKIYDNFVLTDKALWKLKGFLETIGMKADGKIVLDLDKLVGKTCIISVMHEEYEGKTRAKIDDYKKLGASPSAEDDEDEDFDDEDEDFEEAPPKKDKKADKKKDKKKVEDDEDDEEEEKPKKKQDKKKKEEKPKKQDKKKPVEDDDDDWDDEDDDDDNWD